MRNFYTRMFFILIFGYLSSEIMGSEINVNYHNYNVCNSNITTTSVNSRNNSGTVTKIGNYIWRDNDGDGLQENTDFPLKGVVVELISNKSNTVIASTKSDAKGNYEFNIDDNIEPGKYFLRFSFYNQFIPTIKISGNEDFDSDIDENFQTNSFYLPSEKTYLDFDAGFYPILLSYNNDLPYDCYEAPIFKYSELINRHSVMPEFWQITHIPGCGSGYYFQNPVWFGFIAGDTTVNFLIKFENCQTDIGEKGIQWGVYESCETDNMIAGSCSCIDVDTLFIGLDSLITGNAYYLFIDGCNGSVCHYLFQWLSGYCDNEVADADTIFCRGEDDDREYFCGNKNYIFYVDSIKNAEKYTWKIGDKQIETEKPELGFKFENEGFFDISVFGSSYCSLGKPVTRQIYALDTIYGNLGKINATHEQLKDGFLPPGWQGPELTKYGKDSVLVFNYYGCGQWQYVEITESLDYINLMAFYNATNGPQWAINYGWREGADSTNCDPCNGWYGIKCKDAKVISIELPNNKLYGNIPKELYNLSALKILKLNNNELFGTLPDSISKLENLEDLNLSFNTYSTSLPTDFSKLNNLKSLYLNGNQFNSLGSFNFKMTSLVNLDLSDNYLSGDIPAYINMPNLENLSLSDNNYFGSIPAELGNCVNLKSILLNNNKFIGSIPEELSKLKSLWRLDLSNNQFSGKIPDKLFSLPELNVLKINDNKLDGELFNRLKLLKKLSFLYCDNNNFSGAMDSSFGTMTNLSYISASNNRFEGQLPSELFKSSLSYLNLSKNNFTGMIPLSIGNSIYITDLDLSYNNFQDVLPKEVGKLAQLHTLYLNDNNFTGSIPNDIVNLNYINRLNLKNNQFEGSIPEQIGGMYNLIEIDISNNKLTGSIPKEIALLDSLKEINLKNNNLSGCFPTELKSLCKPTITKIFNNNKLLPWEGDFTKFCDNIDQIGSPCDDGDDSNGVDNIDINCKCAGTLDASDIGVENINYNNPVGDLLIIQSEKAIDAIEIYDLKFTPISKYSGIKSQEYKIDFSKFISGVYFMKVVISDNVKFIKLIKD